MDLVLLGIQGSGKGTQAKKLAADFGYDIFETGAELRKLAATDTDLGRKVKSFIDAGNLAPHEIVMQVVHAAIHQRPQGQKILFDGIPRNMEQMESFNEIMREEGRDFRSVQILANLEACVQRILGRAKVEGRIDDQNEEAIRRRMGIFQEKTMPVIEEYKKQGKMSEVDGNGSVEEVYERLKGTLGL